MAVNNLVNIKIKAVENLSDKLDGIKESTKWVENGINNMKKKIESMQPTFQKMAWYWTAVFWALTFWANNAINSATDLQETTNKMNVVFQDLWDEAEKTAKRLADSYWLSSQEAKGFIADLWDMTTGFGLGQKESLDYAEKVSQLWVDLASFTNLAWWSAEAVDRLNKGFLWEHENLKALGIIINETLLTQQLQADGTAHLTWLELERAKIQARMNIAMKQTVNAQGDYERSSGTLAQQQRELSARTADLTASIWWLLAPIKLWIIDVLEPFIEKITTLIEKNPELSKNIIIATTAVAWLVAIIWTLWLAIPAIITGFWAIATASKALWVALRFLALNPIWLVITAIAAGIAIWVAIVKNWDTIKEKAWELWENMLALWEHIYNVWFNIWANISKKVQEIKEAITTKITEAKNTVVWVWQQLWDALTSLTDSSAKWIQDKFQALRDFIQSVFDFANNIYWKVQAIWDKASKAASNVASSAKNAASNVWDKIWSWVSAVWGFITGARATWWPVVAWSTYRVNEQGQEFFTPTQSGTITPAWQSTANININMWGVVVQKEADENRLVEKVKTMLTREAKLYNIWIS